MNDTAASAYFLRAWFQVAKIWRQQRETASSDAAHRALDEFIHLPASSSNPENLALEKKNEPRGD